MVGAAVTLQGELIAAETQLHGLEPIYSDSNIRLQSLRAHIAELHHQLAQIRAAILPKYRHSTQRQRFVPQLPPTPALGLTYADLYRELKIREVVFETLTQQYEMAKIAEAKEIPSVKVLDPANLPEKKSGPHRAIITLLGLIVSFALGAIFLIGKSTWTQVDPDDPRKALVIEVWHDTRPLRLLVTNTTMKIRTKFRKNSTSREPNIEHRFRNRREPMSAVAPAASSELTRGRLLARNTLWNLLGSGAPAVIALLAIPVLVRHIGVPRFGLLTLIWTVVGYFSLFDLGLGAALTRMVADRLGTGKTDEIPSLVWTSLALMLGLSIIGTIAWRPLTALAHRVLKVPAELQRESVQAFLLLAGCLPFMITTTGLRGILEAQQRFGIVNAIRIPTNAFSSSVPWLSCLCPTAWCRSSPC